MTIPFNAGCNPTITIVNHAEESHLDPAYLAKMVAALQKYVDEYFTPIYGFGCKLELSADGTIPAGNWGLAIVNRSPDAGILGYHDRTEDGRPQMLVAVLDTLDAGDTLEDVIPHEILETLADPGTILLLATNERQTEFVAGEVSDPVQGEFVEVDGFKFASFVYPAWFQYWTQPGPDVKFDATGACTKPLQVLRGGYVSKFKHGAWTEKFGSLKARRKFAKRAHGRAARRGCRKAHRKGR